MKKKYEAPVCRTLCWSTREELTTGYEAEEEEFPYGPMSEMIEEW